MQLNNFSTKSDRINSLDTLRGIAIILVMLYHYSLFITHKSNFGILSVIGWVGVDLFFVLSGYLISSHVFQEIELNRFSLKKFYIKRIFKTLPNYYLVLALYFSIPNFTEKPLIISLWKYLFFIQNFTFLNSISTLPHSGFSQSWSLCVEEQFYLFFPLITIFLLKLNKKYFIYTLSLIILVGLVLRGIIWQDLYLTNNLKNYSASIYYPTYCRLDGLIAGIIIAYLQQYSKIIWNRISRYGNTLLLAGLLISPIFIIISFKIINFIPTLIVFPGISLGFAIIVISALSTQSIISKYKFSLLSKIAKWSYAIYLIQKPISILLAAYFTKLGLDNNSYIVILINFSCQILAGYILYNLVEYRFMLIRNKLLTQYL